MESPKKQNHTKQTYERPALQRIAIDHEISVVLMSPLPDEGGTQQGVPPTLPDGPVQG